MKKVTLLHDAIWRGQFYAAGDRTVPDDMAIALGLLTLPEAEPKSDTLTHSEPEPPKPATRRRTTKAEG